MTAQRSKLWEFLKGESGQCALLLRRREKAEEYAIPLGLTFKSQTGFSSISKAKIFSVFGHRQELLNGDLSLRKDLSINHLHSCWKWLRTIPVCLANINIDHVHF